MRPSSDGTCCVWTTAGALLLLLGACISRQDEHCAHRQSYHAAHDRYIYAGVGTSLPLGPSTGVSGRRGEGPALEEDDLTAYRKLARHADPFGLLQVRSLRSQLSHL
jgi:hypothetical protein